MTNVAPVIPLKCLRQASCCQYRKQTKPNRQNSSCTACLQRARSCKTLTMVLPRGLRNLKECMHQVRAIVGVQSARQHPERLYLRHQALSVGARQHQQADQHMDTDASTCMGSMPDSIGAIAAVVVITHNRPEYLKKCMSSVMQVHVKDPSNRCIQY